MTKIQIALDDISSDAAVSMLETMDPKPEIIEAGTLLLLKEGTGAIEKLRRAFPDARILADPKIMDAPDKMAAACFEAGADIVTVMRAASDSILKKTADTARKYGGKLSVDFLHGTNYSLPEEILPQIASLCFHIPRTADASGSGQPDFSDMKTIQQMYPGIEIAAAGGLNESNVHEAVENGADILILGRTLYGADSPVKTLQSIRSRCEDKNA